MAHYKEGKLICFKRLTWQSNFRRKKITVGIMCDGIIMYRVKSSKGEESLDWEQFGSFDEPNRYKILKRFKNKHDVIRNVFKLHAIMERGSLTSEKFLKTL